MRSNSSFTINSFSRLVSSSNLASNCLVTLRAILRIFGVSDFAQSRFQNQRLLFLAQFGADVRPSP